MIDEEAALSVLHSLADDLSLTEEPCQKSFDSRGAQAASC